MRVLVTGGAGFIGSHLVERLVHDLHASVTVVDNLRRGNLDNLASVSGLITFLRADIRDRNRLIQAMSGCDCVFHLAAQANVMGAVQDLDYSFQTNVNGTFQVLQAACASGVRRVVFTSSREVYGESTGAPVLESAPLRPKNAYGISKAAGEMYCGCFRSSSLETVILRLANVYGQRDRDRVIPAFIENALLGKPLTLFGGRQVLDLVWIDIAVDALLKAGLGEWIAEPVNIASGKGTRIGDLAHAVLNLTGSVSKVQVAPARSVEVEQFVADVTRARQVFDLKIPADPLFGLPAVVEQQRQSIRPILSF